MAEERSVIVRIKAEISAFKRDMDAAAKAAEDLGKKTSESGKRSSEGLGEAQKAAAEARAELLRVGKAAHDAAGDLGLSYDATGSLRDEFGRLVTEAKAAELGLDRASDATKEFAAEQQHAADKAAVATSRLGQLEEIANKHEEAWGQVSNGLVAGGVAVVGGLTLATKAAMDWESAWTGVLKTVDGSDAELGAVEDGLRGLAKTLPSTHTEIAGVAESAGQLGVATKDVVGFTKTMIDLGESTNLTADDAATNIAQISNVMGTMKRDGVEGVQRFGAALVALGNDGASTEAEILSMAQRIAGAGATIGASESDVLALSNTLASMGVKAELGGGVTTRVLLKMYSAVQEGGETLDAFAQTAGMSAEQFAEAFRTSPVEALDAVNKGLGRVKDEGGNVVATMKDLGIKGTEETQVMLALAASGDLLSDSLKLGNQAWAENTALVDEADKRYETSSSKIKIAWNNMKDSAIDAGAVILPAVAGIADAAATVASAFGDLPQPMQTFLVAGTALVGVAMLAAGGLMKVSANALSTAVGLKLLAAESPRAAAGLGKVAKAAGAVAALATIGPTIAAMVPSGATADADKVSTSLLQMGKGGEEAKKGLSGLNEMFTGKGGFFDGLDVNGIEDAFKVLGNRGVADNIDLVLSKTLSLGTRGSSNIEFAKKNFEQLDAQLAMMSTNGNTDAAAKSYEMIAESARNAGVDQAILTEHFPEYAKALSSASAETEQAAASSQLLGTAMGVAFPVTKDMAEGLESIGVSADGSITAIDKLLAVLWQLSDGTLDVRAANRAVEDSFRSMEESIKTNGKSLDETTAKGSANQAALDGYIGTLKQRTNAIATAVDENGELVHSDDEVQQSMSKAHEQAIKAAGEFGIFGEKADTLARKLLGIPADVNIKTWLEDFATDRANGITGALDAMPERKDIKVFVSEDGTTKLTQAQIDAIMGQTVSVEVTDEGTVLNVQGKINGVTDGDARLLVSDDGTVSIVQNKVNTVKDGAAKVNVSADGIYNTQQAINGIKGKSVTVKVGYSDPGSPISFNSLIPGRAYGGRAPGFAGGGRVPATGLGTDMVMGVNERGIPHVRVDDREWVVNRKSSDKHDSLLSMINRDDPRVDQLKGLIGLAGGGRVGAAEKRVQSTKRAYEQISGDKANRLRKLAAKDQLDAAKAELDAVKKSSKASADAAKEESERQGRLGEARFDLRRDLTRGNVKGDMSTVDKLFDLSKNKDYSKSTRQAAGRLAGAMERQLLSLEKQSDRLSESFERATKQRDELLSVKEGIASGLRGEFGLGSYMDKTFEPLTVGGMIGSARTSAQKFVNFSKKLDQLRAKGYSEAIIREIGELGTNQGTEAADALLKGSKSDVAGLNHEYMRMDYWSGHAGASVTKSMYAGGVDAAEGLVAGLESKQKSVEDAFYKLGKTGEKAFRRSLDMHSPSRTLFKAGTDAGDGVVGGGLASIPKVADAFAKMGYAAEGAFSPALSVPPSAEGARYAAQPAGMSGAAAVQQVTINVDIHGATDANAVRRAVVDELSFKFGKQGVRIG